MVTFIDEILADIDWRISELAMLKSIPIKYNFKSQHKEVQIKYSIPAIYSIWEGFVKNCFMVYSNHLNSLSIKREEIALQLLTHQLDSECDFNNPRQAFDSKQRMVSLIDSLLTEIITIKPYVPTESNVNFKVLNKILTRFCIQNIDSSYESRLNKLLLFRNKIAHGENSLFVDMSHIIEFIDTVESLMLEIAINVEKYEKIGTYKK